MNHLLKAMGFWVWGLVAIGLSVSMVSVSYRLAAVYSAHEIHAHSVSSPTPGPPAFPTLPKSEKKPAGQPLISRAVGGEIKAAQRAMQSGQWSEALSNLDAAAAKSPLTTYDSKTIEEFRGISYVRLNNLKAAQTAYEASLATGAYKAEELGKMFRLLFQLAATNKQDAKAIEYGERAAAAGAATENDLLIMSQLQYQQHDCKNSGGWGDKAMAAFKVAGEPPREVLYQLKLQCASNGNDIAAMKAALVGLIRLTNKTSYWSNLIRLERQDEHDNHDTLMIYRVMFDTHSMNADTDYIEMAQLLGDAGLPGEAQAVLEKAMSSGVLKDEHKERTLRLLNALATRAEVDKAGLPALDAEATKNPAAQLDVTLGEVYFAAGDFEGAVTAFRRGIGKGQLTRPDEAYVYLGRSLTAEKDPEGAKQAFAKLKSLPTLSPRVLKLWNLYADMLPETAPL
jgi:predicted negative regulator of RcsB-dependent stress response